MTHLEDAAVEALVAYDWPGNIRELENTLQRAVVLAEGPAVTLDDLPGEIRRGSRRRVGRPVGSPARELATVTAPASSPPPKTWEAPSGSEPFDDLDAEVEAYERRRLVDAMTDAQGNKSEAARLLGMPRSTFFSKLKKHGLA